MAFLTMIDALRLAIISTHGMDVVPVKQRSNEKAKEAYEILQHRIDPTLTK